MSACASRDPSSTEGERFYELAGEIVDAIAPHTEADPAELLVTFLVEFGSACGRNAYCIADGARHYPNKYAVIVGDTSKARIGTTSLPLGVSSRSPVLRKGTLHGFAAVRLSIGDEGAVLVVNDCRYRPELRQGWQLRMPEALKEIYCREYRFTRKNKMRIVRSHQ
jgi:hypothetical protein